MKVKDIHFRGKDVDGGGEIGIEIEMEGENIPNYERVLMGTQNVWKGERDGSLRGQSVEFVLRRPVPRKDVNTALRIAKEYLEEKCNAIMKPSSRTGVHVHINVRDLTLNQVFVFMITWFLVEEAMVAYCGETREGNLFCLRLKDAEALLDYAELAIRHEDLSILHTDEIRYSAMNTKSLLEYGSLEFRCLETPENILDIALWVELLLKIKDYSLKIKDPEVILQDISINGGEKFAKEIFGELLPLLPVKDWTELLYDSLRKIQPLVYARNWEEEAAPIQIELQDLPKNIIEAKKQKLFSARQIIDYGL